MHVTSDLESATLKAGHYKCSIKVSPGKWADHTFCQIVQDKVEYWFDCYGGHGEDEKKYRFPVNLYKPTFLRHKSKTSETEVPVNLALARGICCGNPHDERKIFDRHTGGDKIPWLFGDCSGLVYGLMGVCHQMCNRVMMSANRETARLINRPRSFEASYWLYGYWGGGVWPVGAFSFFDGVKGTSAMKLVKAVEQMLQAEGENELQKIRAELENFFLDDLKQTLDNAYGPETRRTLIEELLGAAGLGATNAPLIQDILELDSKPQAVKKDVDRQLLEGTITTNGYAQAINDSMRDFFIDLRELIGSESFDAALGIDPESESTVIVPEHMPELEQYTQLGEDLRTR